MPPNNRLQRTALCAVVFCGCAAFARRRLSLRPLRFVLPPSHQRRLFRGAAFRAFYSIRAQPGAQADLRQKPRSPLSSTLGRFHGHRSRPQVRANIFSA